MEENTYFSEECKEEVQKNSYTYVFIINIDTSL